MKHLARTRSAYEVASQNLRNCLAYFYRELQVPADAIRLQVEGTLQSFKVQDAYELEQQGPPDGSA